MKYFCFFLMMAGILRGAEIGLEALPYTSATYFWTHDGLQLPRLNCNLAGNPIRIGGVEFKRGIVGHTGFSMIYNINRAADEFKALAGVEDEDHPNDDKNMASSLRIEIYTDRKLVYNQLVKLGEVPVPVKVDLSGKSQLELRAVWDKGFRRQRIAFGDPILKTVNPDKLKNELRLSRERRIQALEFAPEYPEPPAWKNIKAERISFHQFNNAYKLSNAAYEIILLPEFGGRVIHYSKPDGDNLLYVQSDDKYESRMVRGKSGDFGGGHFMRLQPNNYFFPADVVLKHGKYEIEFGREGELTMRSAVSEHFFVRYEYRIRLEPETLEITGVQHNTATFAQPLGIWSIVRVPTAEIDRIVLPPGAVIPEIVYDMEKIHQKGFEVQCPAQAAQYRTRMRNGKIFNIKYHLTADDLNNLFPYHAVHVYSCHGYTELEAHTPTLMTVPGASVSLRETWRME